MTVRVYCAPAALDPDVAVTTNVNVPPWVGDPDRTPVDGSSDSPLGSEPLPMVQVTGEAPEAVNVAEKGVLYTASGSAADPGSVMTSGVEVSTRVDAAPSVQ